MKLRSSGHDPTCALFITQECVVPLPFPKPLSKLMTPKHWLQEPHLTALHKHSGLTAMCSQYKPAQIQMKLFVAILPGHQITKHRSWPLKHHLHCSPGSESLPAAQVKKASHRLQSSLWKGKTASMLTWKRELTVVALLLPPILHIRAQHWSMDKK